MHLVPFLHEVANRPLPGVDYDLLMADPRGQLERIARRLAIPVSPDTQTEIGRFAGEFLDATLRHTVFGLDDVDATTEAGRLTHDAYGLLLDLAADRREPDAAFWRAWQRIRTACRTSLAWPSTA
jgi:O-antigen biosynthesis protein